MISAESDDDSSHFIIVRPEQKHRAASDDPNIEHLIVASRPNGQPIGFVILAGLQGEHWSIEHMRLALTDKGKGYGRAAAIKRHAFETLSGRRLWLDVKVHNTRARAAYEKEVFRYEGAPPKSASNRQKVLNQ
ncbi:MAG TPA: GNAT family protein [Blastocatellia bacterium]